MGKTSEADDMSKILTTEERAKIKEAMGLVVEATADDGDSVELRGFGTFTRKTMAAKTARNPQNGDEVKIPPRSVLRFKASKKTSRDL